MIFLVVRVRVSTRCVRLCLSATLICYLYRFFSAHACKTLRFILKDGYFNATTMAVVKVTDVQNRPPVFLGSMSAIVSEDVPVVSLFKAHVM